MNTPQLPQLSPAALEGLRALLTLIESGLASAPPPPVAPRRTIQEVGNEMLVSKARTGKSPRYLLVLRSTLSILFKGRMLRQAHTITAEEIESWSSGQWTPRTKRNFITTARTFFAFAQRRAYVSSNPALALDLPPHANEPVAIQTPEQVRAVMLTAQRLDPATV